MLHYGESETYDNNHEDMNSKTSCDDKEVNEVSAELLQSHIIN